MSDQPRKLLDNEVIALAYRLCERQLATEWFEWEDIPMLGQYDCERVVEKMGTVRNYLREARILMERTWDIDTSALLDELGG